MSGMTLLALAALAASITFGPMPSRQHHRRKAPALSPGCAARDRRGLPLPQPPDPGTPFWTVSVVDELGALNRTAYVAAPAPAPGRAATPRPLLLGFHGQSGTGLGFAQQHAFTDYAARDGWVTAWPDGLGDAPTNEPGGNTGWNIGTNGDNLTCVDPMPDAADVVCHDSCVKLGRCGRCSWSTCRDDIAFVRVLMQRIFHEYCIDTNLVFVMGQSNGAMFAHRLGQQLVGQFAAIIPVFGLPLLGYLTGEVQQACACIPGAHTPAPLRQPPPPSACTC